MKDTVYEGMSNNNVCWCVNLNAAQRKFLIEYALEVYLIIDSGILTLVFYNRYKTK